MLSVNKKRRKRRRKKITFQKVNYKKILKPLSVILVGFIGGVAGTLLILNMAGISINNVSGSSTKTTTSKVSYSNTNDTTKAVEKVREAVVSVINYQSNSSSNDLYMQMFGGNLDNNTNNGSDSDLSIASEGSGVISKKTAILLMSLLITTLSMVLVKSKSCFLTVQK